MLGRHPFFTKLYTSYHFIPKKRVPNLNKRTRSLCSRLIRKKRSNHALCRFLNSGADSAQTVFSFSFAKYSFHSISFSGILLRNLLFRLLQLCISRCPAMMLYCRRKLGLISVRSLLLYVAVVRFLVWKMIANKREMMELPAKLLSAEMYCWNPATRRRQFIFTGELCVQPQSLGRIPVLYDGLIPHGTLTIGKLGGSHEEEIERRLACCVKSQMMNKRAILSQFLAARRGQCWFYCSVEKFPRYSAPNIDEPRQALSFPATNPSWL